MLRPTCGSRSAAINVDLKRDYGVEIKVRTALHTGDVVAGAGETLVTGDAVNVAARLEQNAKAGEILLGDQTARLLGEAALMEPVPELTLKGKAAAGFGLAADQRPPGRTGLHASDHDPVRRPPQRARVARGRVRARGRRVALRAGDGARAAGDRQVAPACAKPFHRSAAARGFVVGRCLPYGEGITYWPLVEIVKQVAGHEPRAWIAELLSGDENAELVADARRGRRRRLGAGRIDRRDPLGDTQRCSRRWRGERPLVVVLEDLHWAEPRFLDLVEYVAGFSRERPILLLVSARPELLETRPTWAKPGENAELLVLEPLAEPEVDSARGRAPR